MSGDKFSQNNKSLGTLKWWQSDWKIIGEILIQVLYHKSNDQFYKISIIFLIIKNTQTLCARYYLSIWHKLAHFILQKLHEVSLIICIFIIILPILQMRKKQCAGICWSQEYRSVKCLLAELLGAYLQWETQSWAMRHSECISNVLSLTLILEFEMMLLWQLYDGISVPM